MWAQLVRVAEQKGSHGQLPPRPWRLLLSSCVRADGCLPWAEGRACLCSSRAVCLEHTVPSAPPWEQEKRLWPELGDPLTSGC